MNLPRPPHRWKVSPAQAIRLQRDLADRVRVEPLDRKVRLVAGVDATASTDGRWLLAGVVVWDLYKSGVLETRLASRLANFPYVPGLLSFREVPAVLAAVRRLRVAPDVFLFDGQGMAHPRRFGLASHAGVIMDCPTVGCAKSRLCGQHEEPAMRRGSRRRLIDPSDRQTIGAVVRTRDRVKCVYVSIGHRVTLADAIRLVLACHAGYRIPQPLRLAHQLVTAERAHL